MHANNNKFGLVVGAFLGLWHLMWSVLVAVGLAQPLLDFIFRIHFLANPYQVAPFGFKRAITLIVVTVAIGYLMGWVIAWLWNKIHAQVTAQ